MVKITVVITLLFLNSACLGAELNLAVIGKSNENLKPNELIDDDLKKEAIPPEQYNTIIFALSNLYYFFKYPNQSEAILAIKQFQKDFGEKETGKLTKKQYIELLNRTNMVFPLKIVIAQNKKIDFYSNENYVHAKGTLKLLDEDIAFPMNISDIFCLKKDNYCEMNQAVINDSLLLDNLNFFMDKFQYDIINWSKNEISARHEYVCRIQELKINLTDKTVYIFTTNNNSKECQDLPFQIESLSKPSIALLVPGYDESKKFNAKKKEKRRNSISSIFFETMKGLFK